jgi:chromate transport protein ChrA
VLGTLALVWILFALSMSLSKTHLSEPVLSSVSPVSVSVIIPSVGNISSCNSSKMTWSTVVI